MKKNILHVGTKSASRKQLLEEAEIPFILVDQNMDETICNWNQPLEKVVQQIAQAKMEHLIFGAARDSERRFFLTADTLSRDNSDGIIRGKPQDREQARIMIKAAQQGSTIATAFCLDVKVYKNSAWVLEKRILKIVMAQYLFYVPDEWIEIYLDCSRGLSSSGSIAIEGFGAQFLRTINGSYSTIVGLPMCELREALQECGFF